MYKGELLNASILAVLGEMGHTDQLTIGDAGLPIPSGVKRIDLAVTKNLPSFLQTFDVVFETLEVEAVILAEEIKQQNPALMDALAERLHNVPITYIPHEAFKVQTQQSKAVIRTGECSPYANIILVSGVTFK